MAHDTSEIIVISLGSWYRRENLMLSGQFLDLIFYFFLSLIHKFRICKFAYMWPVGERKQITNHNRIKHAVVNFYFDLMTVTLDLYIFFLNVLFFNFENVSW